MKWIINWIVYYFNQYIKELKEQSFLIDKEALINRTVEKILSKEYSNAEQTEITNAIIYLVFSKKEERRNSIINEAIAIEESINDINIKIKKPPIKEAQNDREKSQHIV